MTGEDMWQLIMFSTVRFTFGCSPKSEAHDISVFRVTKRSDAKVYCWYCELLLVSSIVEVELALQVYCNPVLR